MFEWTEAIQLRGTPVCTGREWAVPQASTSLSPRPLSPRRGERELDAPALCLTESSPSSVDGSGSPRRARQPQLSAWPDLEHLPHALLAPRDLPRLRLVGPKHRV